MRSEKEIIARVQEALDTEWPLIVIITRAGRVKQVRNGFGLVWRGWRKILEEKGVPCSIRRKKRAP